jgi:hypothetical protein
MQYFLELNQAFPKNNLIDLDGNIFCYENQKS